MKGHDPAFLHYACVRKRERFANPRAFPRTALAVRHFEGTWITIGLEVPHSL